VTLVFPVQFMSERAQVELDYSAHMEALGRKYSNSITAAAQNPLLTHSTTHAHTASIQGAVNDAAKASKTGKTPSKPTTAAVTSGPATPTVPLSASAVSRSFHTITSLGGVLSASKPTAGAEAVNTPGSPEEVDPELDDPVGRHRTARAVNVYTLFLMILSCVRCRLLTQQPDVGSTQRRCALLSTAVVLSAYHFNSLVSPFCALADTDGDINEADALDAEETYLNRDASAVLFNSLAAMHIASAERMRQVCFPVLCVC
jgi:hypothetical protein